uniref:Fibrinogen alpha chain n=3 Tax=Cyprinus carpio TaxID=7962 RepID=A0A9J8AS95_CYPCA
MKLTHSLLCLFVVVSSALSDDTVVNPRGARPIEHGYKAQDTCKTKEWQMCTDDDWGNKCPSGCRVQGLMDKADHDIIKKIENIRRLLDEGRKLYRSADQVSKNTYSYLRERLTSSAGNDNRYTTLAEQLRQRITDIKIKIDRQLRLLDALKSQVKDQVIVIQRLEVDIDIKLRTCKGSCASYTEFSVDRESYAALDKQMDHLNTLRVQNVETVSSLGIMKSRPLKDLVLPSIYKSGTGKAEQKQLLFGDVGQMKLTLEAEGSTAESAATVSKFPTSDCAEILQKHANGGQSGLFKIKPAGSEEIVEVYCDQGTGLGGWTLVQQREDGSVNFNRTWKEYRNGFGRLDQQVCTALKSSLKQHNHHGYTRFGHCPARPTYPLCSDEEREDKCPSGCHLEGLINLADEDIRKRLRNICERIQENQDVTSSVMQKSVQFYGSQRKAIIQTYMQEIRYAKFAEDLHRNLTFLHKRSAELAKDLKKHHHLIWDQINEIRRTEVDIDIKIRACKGSCKQTFDHAVDNDAFKAMENKMEQFNIISKRRKSFSKNKKLKLQSVDRPSVSPSYRKIPIVRTELLTKFEDIEQHQVILDELLEDI